MILTIFPIAVVLLLAIYLGRWKASVRRRNQQSWDSLLSRLRRDWSARELSDRFLHEEGLDATPEETWSRIQGPYGLWAMYQNACVMLEMADYAARNCDSIDQDLLAALRSDAMHIRVFVVMAIARYAFSQANESICVYAFRATSMYTGMAARMAELLQVNAGEMLPGFVAAM
jgi:hypothetical protein